MPAVIVSRKPAARAQKAFRVEFTRLMTDTARRVAAEVVAAAGPDGIVQKREAERIAQRASGILRAVFVDGQGRAVLPDGTPVSPYARLLLGACAWVTREQVRKQAAWMRANVPEDIQRWLRRAERPAKEMASRRRVQLTIVREVENPLWAKFTPEDLRARLVADNPLAQYDAPHTWVDPNGYTLNERIWRADADTRARLNAYLRDQIANGNGALNIARGLEQFLVPGREALRTSRPYGSDASMMAMRLARTEISHANNSAALAAARMNPYVTGVEWHRSGTGNANCPICGPLAKKYKLEDAPTPPAHPNCKCFLSSIVTEDADAVADQIRAMMGGSANTTPLSEDEFVRQLLGNGGDASRFMPQLPSRAPVSAVSTPPTSRAPSVSGLFSQKALSDPAFKSAVDLMDRVHGVDPTGRALIDFKYNSRKSSEGLFKTAPGQSGVIEVSKSAANKKITIVHESAHAMDWNVFGGSTRFTTRGAAASTNELKGWYDAVQASEARKAMLRVPASGFQYAQYVTKSEEMWARSYTQYIATKTGDKDMLAEIAATRNLKDSNGNTHWARNTYWDDDDFAPIARAFDALFKAKGWLR